MSKERSVSGREGRGRVARENSKKVKEEER